MEGLALIGWNPVPFDLWAVWIRIKTSPDDHVNCRAAIPVRCAHHLKGKIIEKLRIFVKTSVADPDPKDSYNFARSGSEIFSTDPDPDMNLAHFPNPFPSPSILIPPPSPHSPLLKQPWIRIRITIKKRSLSNRFGFATLVKTMDILMRTCCIASCVAIRYIYCTGQLHRAAVNSISSCCYQAVQP